MSCLLALKDSILSMAIYNYRTKMTRHGHHDLETRHQAFQATSETSQTVLQWTVILLSNYPVTAAKTWSMDQWTEALFAMTRPFKYSQECISIGLSRSWLRNDPPLPILLIKKEITYGLGQRTACRSQLSLPIRWGPGIKLSLSALVTSTLMHRAILMALLAFI